jgi:hypothetical protein
MKTGLFLSIFLLLQNVIVGTPMKADETSRASSSLVQAKKNHHDVVGVPKCIDTESENAKIAAWIELAKKSKYCEFVGLNSGCLGSEGKKNYRKIVLTWHTDHCKHPSVNEVIIFLNGAKAVFEKYLDQVVPDVPNLRLSDIKFDPKEMHDISENPAEPEDRYKARAERSIADVNVALMARGLFARFFGLILEPFLLTHLAFTNFLGELEDNKYLSRSKTGSVSLFKAIVGFTGIDFLSQSGSNFAFKILDYLDDWGGSDIQKLKKEQFSVRQKQFIHAVKTIAHHGPFAEKVFNLWADRFEKAIEDWERYSEPFPKGFSMLSFMGTKLWFHKFEWVMGFSNDMKYRAETITTAVWYWVETMVSAVFDKSLPIILSGKANSVVSQRRIRAMKDMIYVLRRIKQTTPDYEFFMENSVIHEVNQ